METSPSQERRVKTLRRELEGWREVLCALHSVLTWEKHFFPALSVSAVSFLFLIIWYVEPSMLTLMSVLGITTTLCDYLVPQVVPWVVGAHYWTGAHERRYEQIITSIASMFCLASSASHTLSSMKESKPRTYFVVVTGSLLFLAWIGSNINNLFLTYLIVVFLVLLPGLKHQGIINKYFSTVIKAVSNIVKGPPPAKGEATNGDSKKKE
ncbi:ADP-ribosylation factor-like protein 6-interacting protein 1 [Chionoecetes opilio]|uniref:ADP-ribosylation factor-like protein 6-interacting protein 1 n=1 Tax=Chionoecetes opilio TaxID=41210 RepID=A0A8J4YCY8_CHIOP|nr:ADP-ribosylation factor-like protein 6-interacting protein 1 [Chionoecetes opilio]